MLCVYNLVCEFSVSGPVFVEFPIDTLYPYNLVKREIGMKDQKGGGLIQSIIQW